VFVGCTSDRCPHDTAQRSRICLFKKCLKPRFRSIGFSLFLKRSNHERSNHIFVLVCAWQNTQDFECEENSLGQNRVYFDGSASPVEGNIYVKDPLPLIFNASFPSQFVDFTLDITRESAEARHRERETKKTGARQDKTKDKATHHTTQRNATQHNLTLLPFLANSVFLSGSASYPYWVFDIGSWRKWRIDPERRGYD
jgi:hypothetical protein